MTDDRPAKIGMTDAEQLAMAKEDLAETAAISNGEYPRAYIFIKRLRNSLRWCIKRIVELEKHDCERWLQAAAGCAVCSQVTLGLRGRDIAEAAKCVHTECFDLRLRELELLGKIEALESRPCETCRYWEDNRIEETSWCHHEEMEGCLCEVGDGCVHWKGKEADDG